MTIVQRGVTALVVFCTCLPLLAAKWPKYTDEEMFTKADFIVVGKIEEELPKLDNGLQQGRLKVERTLLSEQGGSVKSMIIAYHGPDSEKTIGLEPGVEGVWLLRRAMAANSVVHPQQFRPLAEEKALVAGLSAWLPVSFEEQVAKVKQMRTRDPDGSSSETLASVILMLRRSEQIRVLPGIDDSQRRRDWLQRLQTMLTLYDRKMDFPTEAKTAEDKQKLMEHMARMTGKAPEPGTPLYERMASQAPGMLAHVYSNLIQQTISADDAKFPGAIERIQRDVKDADVERLKTRVSALQYLVDLANAGELR